ncbi:glutathione peroxidase [Swaminathania salitolerans]|uniref:Glutathione peroxidase n=1 Tax=Swaminathania salitolerans TaxID=182838 RepID=A0A511BMD0_9PROT|nr:glutathione peroxidase [Swaminathania salitolerans]GBQ15820.1 glutathione peroxidase [Swaminathania salitolerans LMG 21291]GEL01497.1 glutathione peroxidase [Swaminathania salitolerans]
MTTGFYDLEIPALGTGTIPLSEFRGKVVLIANTASKCGFTPQYEGLQHLWSRYAKDGLVVLGVPSNDFGQQEPGTASEIEQSCSRNYGVSFPMAAKSVVKGPAATPLFRWLAREGGMLSRPRWNFYKYVVSREGKLVDWFTPLTSPDSPRMKKVIQRALMDR